MKTTQEANNLPEQKKRRSGLGAFAFPEAVSSSSRINPVTPDSKQSFPKSFRPADKSQKIGTIRTVIFILLLIILAVTFFTRSRFKSVDAIVPEVLRSPIQTAVQNPAPVVFEKDGFSYKLTPLFDYNIAGLVVHSLKYKAWYSISRTDTVFSVDLCVVWGGNVQNKAYQATSLSVSQDYRFCLFNYTGDIKFFGNELSNNHLVVKDSALEKAVESVSAGDQILIRGKLVNVEATAIGSPSRYELSKVSWQSSTSREDTGAGACEVIFVEDIKILKKGNPVSHFLFTSSGYGLVIIAVWWVAELVLSSAARRKKPNRSGGANTPAA